MCETLFDVFCCIVANKYVVNCRLQLTAMKCVLWALGEGGKRYRIEVAAGNELVEEQPLLIRLTSMLSLHPGSLGEH